MANIVKFKINGLSSALNNVYTRVTDLSRNELYSGETLVSDASGNVELDIGTAGSNGQGVIVYGDNYSAGNESTFKSFCGYGLIEGAIQLYDNVVLFGSSTTDRSFTSTANKSDMSLLLADYGLTPNLITSAYAGSAAEYQNQTLMPATVSANPNLTNTLFFCQAATNSLLTAYSSSTPSERATLSANQSGILTQATAAGWEPVCSNFNITPNNQSREINLWNSDFLRPLVDTYAPKSIISNNFLQDYYSLSSNSYALMSSDNTHLKEISGDRLYRQFSAMNIARLQGLKPNRSLSGRRFVVSWGGVDAASWVNYNNINPMQSSSGGTATETGLSCTAHIKDADTGELIDGVMVYVKGQQGLSATQGRGNAGNNTSTVFNNKACLGYIYHDTTYLQGFEIGITTLDGRALPNAKITIAGSRNVTGTDRKTDWLCNGETKTLDATAIPCGTVVFSGVVADVNNVMKAVGTLPVGSSFSYVSAIEVQFD